MEHNGGAGQQLAAEMPIFKRIRNSRIAIPQIIHSRMGKGASGDIGRTSIRKI